MAAVLSRIAYSDTDKGEKGERGGQRRTTIDRGERVGGWPEQRSHLRCRHRG
jgi:hypothetical protein